MKPTPGPLTDAVRHAARRSVLCWLATVDADGQPNVSPKEVWGMADAQHVVVAHIASPVSARNIAQHRAAAPGVSEFCRCVCSKTFQLPGMAREMDTKNPEFSALAAPLLARVQSRFTVH